jgi:hypothetical protein
MRSNGTVLANQSISNIGFLLSIIFRHSSIRYSIVSGEKWMIEIIIDFISMLPLPLKLLKRRGMMADLLKRTLEKQSL